MTDVGSESGRVCANKPELLVRKVIDCPCLQTVERFSDSYLQNQYYIEIIAPIYHSRFYRLGHTCIIVFGVVGVVVDSFEASVVAVGGDPTAFPFVFC